MGPNAPGRSTAGWSGEAARTYRGGFGCGDGVTRPACLGIGQYDAVGQGRRPLIDGIHETTYLSGLVATQAVGNAASLPRLNARS